MRISRKPDFLRLMVLLLALLVAAPTAAFALSLEQAKEQGMVGERSNGYLGAVQPTPSPEVQAMLTRINAERRKKYEAIAKKNGTSVQVVEKLAAQKAINLTPPGQYIELGNGWQRKQ